MAAIDCGTNSIRLLIADVEGDQLRDVTRKMEIVRLGEGVDRTGRIGDAALERTLTALRGYAERIARAQVAAVRMVATSATRDAANRDDFVAGVQAILGVEPQVVTGIEEAALSFAGATRELGDLPSPRLVVDIGGGSTEFVLGETGGDGAGSAGVRASCSVDVGCVRLTERHLRDDPPSAEQIEAAEADLTAALDRVAEQVPLESAATLVGVAGTVTTIAGIALGLPEYDPARIHLSRITAEQVEQVAGRLLAMTRDERAALAVMHPGRVDVIGGGALVLRGVIRRVGAAEVVASEHDILDGIAYELASSC